MDEKKKLEIAMKLLKTLMREKEFSFANAKRHLGNMSKEFGVTPEEIREFWKPILHELVDEL